MNTNNFVNAMEKEIAWKLTENGQAALNTTFDANLDLFATIGALRSRNKTEIELKISKAYSEDALVAVKMMFYARDIEEGLGERRVFRTCLKWLANNHTKDVVANIENIVKFGRFDDLYELVGTPAEKEAFAYIANVFNTDCGNYREGKPVSLAAKWMKSVNTSSDESKKLGKLTAKYLGLTDKEYRKMLSTLRKYIDVLEVKMSEKNWEGIDFNTVPGGAMKKYCASFYRNQDERYKAYLEALKNGDNIKVVKADGTVVEKEAKINTKKLFPYEIIEKYTSNGFYARNYKPECEAMWNGLKDWVNGVECNTIVVADTSGSMSGRPMCSSVGLASYFAERNSGPFKNRFMTFSTRPTWITFPENCSLQDKINIVGKADWDGSTNLEAAFDLILKTAVNANLTQDDMPKNLVIITDMEFNCVCDNSASSAGRWYSGSTNMTFYDSMKAKYAKYGYTLPEITFWNVNARNDTYHTTANMPHVRMVSGQASSIFKSLIDGKTHTPYEFMLETLSNTRYDSVVLG